MIGIVIGGQRVVRQRQRGNIGVVAGQVERRVEGARVGIDADALAGDDGADGLTRSGGIVVGQVELAGR